MNETTNEKNMTQRVCRNVISRLEYERRIRMKETVATIAVPALPRIANSG